jgi:phosphate transport system protein
VTDHDHLVKAFTAELEALDAKITEMGKLAGELLERAFESIEGPDPSLAETAIAQDKAIDRLDQEVEEEAIALIARRQPMALDLRQIVSAMKISSELERIGDLSKNIAKRTLVISRAHLAAHMLSGLRRMSDLASEQLSDVLAAYAARDAEKALDVWRRDEQIDAAYNSTFRELLTYMMEDPRNIGLCAHLLFAAKNLERVGDHTTNIAERVHFMVKGAAPSERRPKQDETYSFSPGQQARGSDQD